MDKWSKALCSFESDKTFYFEEIFTAKIKVA